MGRVRFCQLSSPSASGPDFVWILPVESDVFATDYAHGTYCILASAVLHMCPRAVTQQCITPFLTVGELRFIIYVFASPYGIHIKPESTVTRYPIVQTYTECSTICGVSVPWLRLQLPHSICSGSSSEIKHALNRSNRGQPSDTFLKENISKTTTGLVLTVWLNGGMTEFACCLNFFKPEADAIIRNMNIQINCLTYT